jgi:hypothetical protein
VAPSESFTEDDSAGEPPGIVESEAPLLPPKAALLFLQPVKVVHADAVIRAASAAATNFFVAFFMFTHSFLFVYTIDFLFRI